MDKADNKARRYHYIVFVLWLILIVIAAKYFLFDSLAVFDPQNKLAQDSTAIISQIKSDLAIKSIPSKKTIIHFTSDDCSCSILSIPHKTIINKKATNNDFEVRNIVLTKENNNVIPSTPAVLVLDEVGELIYLGPYAEGLECSVDNSMVDIVLENYIKGFNANLVINDAKGCYCNM
jgi:hypothetical protein